ncbi:DUF488 domain-containing protein [Heyndrickxia ginsengihumi]|uniref:DUF488 family protein n=1 Tax=Heyndrickxia ginsengihumi TaxID=363870 RepID=A0A0A6VDQ1_9BACI|nr:DUF488 family protein [Heyndrickxia ginsengihumi]KHD85618.1 hypothetical protein NG54_08145 [Heyndrickxia ginsengihumi]MCM3024838.1 DUF488 family protein [Heyndrickxia ginsengihumi]NEY21396.1 DUF488 family protein [Heyndrickxia ginsengihumi]
MFEIKRVYEERSEDDGYRVLVDRLWPRGLTKERANIHYWLKTIAPSHQLRKWFAHDIEKYEEFKRRYIEELEQLDDRSELNLLWQLNTDKKVTLLFCAKDQYHNNAIILKAFLEKKV